MGILRVRLGCLVVAGSLIVVTGWRIEAATFTVDGRSLQLWQRLD